MPESRDSRNLNRVRVMLRCGTTLSKKNPMPLTSVKITELKKKRDELEAKQKQAKEDRETAKIVMVNEHTTKDGEMTRVVVAALENKTTKNNEELSVMSKALKDLVVSDSSSTIDAQTSANRVQISMLQAASRDLRERKQQEMITARAARAAAKAKAAAEKEAVKKAKVEKKAAAKETTAAMVRKCSTVRSGSKRSLGVGNSSGVVGRAEDEKQEDGGCKRSSSNSEETAIAATAPVATLPAMCLSVIPERPPEASEEIAVEMFGGEVAMRVGTSESFTGVRAADLSDSNDLSQAHTSQMDRTPPLTAETESVE